MNRDQVLSWLCCKKTPPFLRQHFFISTTTRKTRSRFQRQCCSIDAGDGIRALLLSAGTVSVAKMQLRSEKYRPLASPFCMPACSQSLVLLCWPLSNRPRHHARFVPIGLCWLYECRETPPSEFGGSLDSSLPSRPPAFLLLLLSRSIPSFIHTHRIDF